MRSGFKLSQFWKAFLPTPTFIQKGLYSSGLAILICLEVTSLILEQMSMESSLPNQSKLRLKTIIQSLYKFRCRWALHQGSSKDYIS